MKTRTIHTAKKDPPGVEDDAHGRLVTAALKLFAERGLEGVSVRELAQEAGVNLAAVNYHFGSKENLYVEALRFKLRSLRDLDPHFDAVDQAERADTPQSARQAIREFIKDYMETLVNVDKRDKFILLMVREMMEPTVAIDMVVGEFIAPRFRALEILIERVRPDLAGTPEASLCAMSIAGQCLYYRFANSVVLRLLKRKKMSPEFLNQVAGHIAEFSLRGLGVSGD
ncbi:MAG TPA: CerR family C-terminal domain-containing protein [Blastocatellia bacterium]|nr:CerR family C-terminal domain-containing protein [Blastocatellia bacterium]